MLPRALLLTSALTLAGCASAPPGAAPLPPGRHGTLVAWEDWAPETFARAKRTGRLILVNVAAGWCHWCHVMDRETFGDPAVARLIAARFVPVRVDADARPDVAERYARWGWPATAVLTPDARPVTERRGYQAPTTFLALLRELSDAHAAGRPLAREAAPSPPPVSDLDAVMAALRAQLDARYDHAHEGWGEGQKYPFAAPIEHALLRAAVRPDDPAEVAWRERALATLRAQLALMDPVWGGLFQYSDDGTWGGGPHREKIVPVQTGALEAYCLAYQVTDDAGWLEPARELRRYLIERLRAPDGTFFASQDADTPTGSGLDGAAFYALDDAGRRAAPAAPRVDMNVYADLNGRVIRALCRLHMVTGDPAPLAEAVAAATVILRTHAMYGPVHGPSLHADLWFRHAPGDDTYPPRLLLLADHVAMGGALLALYEATGETTWLDEALALAAGLRDFELPSGGLRAARGSGPALNHEHLPWRENAEAARFLLRLHAATEDDVWREQAERALRALLADPARVTAQGRIVGEALLALEELALDPVSIVVVGPPGDPAADELLQAARRLHLPRGVVLRLPPGERYPDLGRAAAFLCGGGVCSAPVEQPDALPGALEAFTPTLR